MAYTAGPGLIGALLVGAGFAASLGARLGQAGGGHTPFGGAPAGAAVGARSARLSLSGVAGVRRPHPTRGRGAALGEYRILGETLDDAAGEAFDKTAKLLGLPYPGGAALAKLAETGRSGRFVFPRPMLDRPGLEFSFSGLKTAALVALRGRVLDDAIRADVARGFQEAVVETLAEKCRRALEAQRAIGAWSSPAGSAPIAACANGWPKWCAAPGAELHFPRAEFCTDNGAMIALAGCMRLAAGMRQAAPSGRGRIGSWEDER